MKQKNLPQTQEISQPRRRFFDWISKIASGAALAGVSLGDTHTSHALAAPLSKDTALLLSSLKRQTSARPDCIECTNCMMKGCTYSYEDWCDDPHYPYLLKWELDAGCAPNCQITSYLACVSNCDSPC